MSGNLIDNYLTSRKTPPSSRGWMNRTNSTFGANVPPAKPDSVEYLGMSTDLQCTKSNCTQYILEGQINNQESFIKTVRIDGPRNEKHEGFIGNKKLDLHSITNESDNVSKTYVGTFNNKNINLSIEHDCKPNNDGWLKSYFKKNVIRLPNNVTIKGTIDDKPYEINLPHTKIPRDSDEKDLVALLVKNESLEIATIKDEIVGFQPDNNKWDEYLEKKELKTKINQILAGIGTGAIVTAIGKVGFERLLNHIWPLK